MTITTTTITATINTITTNAAASKATRLCPSHQQGSLDDRRWFTKEEIAMDSSCYYWREVQQLKKILLRFNINKHYNDTFSLYN